MQHTQAIHAGSLAISKRSAIVQSLWIGLFAVLTAIGAQIEIPHQPVPYTMQTLFVLLSGAVLGKRNGALAQLSYVALGTLGLPVFSGFSGGLLRLFGPTGGYLLAFPVAAYVTGYVFEGRSTLFRSFAAMIAGAFVIFTLGTLQLNMLYFHNWTDAFLNGFLIFSWWDMVKIGAAAMIAHQIAVRNSNVS